MIVLNSNEGGFVDNESFDETLEDIEGLPSTSPQHVYVMYAEGTRWIKIGFALDVETRRRQLQTGCPHILRILFQTPAEDAPALEGMLKAHFAPYRLQGEWFTLPENVPAVLDLFAVLFQYNQAPIRYNDSLSPLQKMAVTESRVLQALGGYEWLGLNDLMAALGAPPSDYSYIRRIVDILVKQGVVGKLSYGKYCLTSKPLPPEEL